MPVQRPRVRGEEGDVKIGSYELFRRDEEQQKRIAPYVESVGADGLYDVVEEYAAEPAG